jgi:hypothetical protein
LECYVQKRKVEGRAAKLVKMAHSARATRQDTEGAVRKVKFRLPIADVDMALSEAASVFYFLCVFLLEFLLTFIGGASPLKSTLEILSVLIFLIG